MNRDVHERMHRVNGVKYSLESPALISVVSLLS